MSRHAISDQTLKISVNMRLEAGVSDAAVRETVNEYAGDSESASGSEIVGFLWVEDIPQARRAEFLAALSSLLPEPDLITERRMVSANDIWPSRLGI
jgi:hypothetical protein